MLAKTHLAFGLLAGLLIAPFLEIPNQIIFFTILLISSILPDIDQPNSKISNNIPIIPTILSIFIKHRGIFHSIFILILITALIYSISPIYSTAVFIGYASHILIDAFTKQGINFLNPITQLRLSGFIETGKSAELLLFIILLALITINIL